RAHIEGEVPVLVDVAQNLRAVKRRVELEQGQARELVIGLETEEAEVDLQKRFEEEINLAGDVEHGDRIKVVGLEVRRDFAEPNLVVVVEIVEEEINARGDAALDTGLRNAEIDLGACGHFGRERSLRNLLSGFRVERVDEETVQQIERILGFEELEQTGSIIAEGEIEFGLEQTNEKGEERWKDWEFELERELEAELRQRVFEQRDIGLAHQQLEYAGGLQDREAQAASARAAQRGHEAFHRAISAV